MHKRQMSMLLVIILILSLLPQLAIPAHAAYENTYKNTGNQRADIIGVALTQLGYLEGGGKSNNNQNKYSEYFGYGKRSWCGDFVSWCARQANIPESVIKTNGRALPSKFGIKTVYEEGYTPRPGDLFFKSNYGHVGIVYKVEGKYFWTLEGNTWTSSPRKDGVYSRKREISKFYFGVPNYAGDTGDDTCKHSFSTKNESAHPHKEYKICSKCSYITYTGNETTVSSCKTCKQENCAHKYAAWESTGSSKHQKSCTLCGKKVSESHSWGPSMITAEPTCNKDGKKTSSCKYCDEIKTTKIKATGVHAVDETVYINSKYHGQTCEDCGKVIKSKHTVVKEWTADGKNHWYYCSGCGERYQLAEHVYTAGCSSPCKVCKYISPFIHDPAEDYTSDETGHWKICLECSTAIDKQPHSYQSDCDQLCDICNYQRTAPAAHVLVTETNENEHWQTCTGCSQINDKQAHTPDPNAKDWEDQLCTDCGIVLRSADLHVHTYESIKYDRHDHWGTCACGQAIQEEVHQFDPNAGICTVCHAIQTPIGAKMPHDRLLMAGIIAFGALIAVMLLILIIRRISKRRYY